MKTLRVLKTFNEELRRLAALSLMLIPFGFLQAESVLPAPAGFVEMQPSCENEKGMIRITSPAPGAGITFSIDGSTYTNTTGVFERLDPGTYSVTFRNAEGSISEPLVLTVNSRPEIPAPVTAVVTRQPSCEIPTGIITITSPSPATGLVFTYYYNQQEGVSNTSGVFTGLAPGQYYLTVTNAEGCSSYATPVTLNFVPGAPAIPVLSVSQTCGVLTGTITVTSPTPAEGISYSIDGINFNNTTGVFTNLVPGTYNISVKNAAGCLSAPRSAAIVDATVALPAPVVRIVEQPQCDLIYGDIDVTEPGPDGLITYSIDGINYNSVTGAIGSLNPGTYNVTYKTAQGCISPATSVTIIDGPDTPAEGPVLAVTSQPSCDSPTGTITVNSPAPGQIYYINLGQEIASSTTGVFPGLMPGFYMVYYKTAGGCYSPNSSITVGGPTSGNPAQPGEFTNSATYMCAGTSTTFTVPLDESVIYKWNYTGTGAMITGNGNSVMVFFSETATSGILSVVAQNSCGSSPARDLAVTVRQLPGPAGTISGPSVVCLGEKSVVYSVAVIPNAVHYLWKVPEGATIVSGEDTYTITVDFSGTAVSGAITVQGSKKCGTGEVSPELFITAGHQIPNRPSAFMDSTTYVCAVATARYQVRADPGVNYIWSYTGAGTVIETPFDSGTWLFFTENATSGTLSVVATSECGTSEARTIEITVRQLPGPAGKVSGPTEVCLGTRGVVYSVPVIPNAVHYIWTLPAGATIVSGANTNSITVDFADDAYSGSITVQGSKNCGTGSVSPALQVNVTKPVSAKKALESGDIGIYPVPNKGAFNITFDTEGEKDVTIMVFNSSGIKVFEMKNVIISERTELPFNLSALPAGLYFMKFYDGMGVISKTIILSR